MKKTVLFLSMLVAIVACEKKEIVTQVSPDGSKLLTTRKGELQENSLENLKRNFQIVGEFHNNTMANFYATREEISEDVNEQIEHFSIEETEANLESVCVDCIEVPNYFQTFDYSTEETELLGLLEGELDVVFSKSFKNSYARILDILNNNLSVKATNFQINEVLNNNYYSLSNELEQTGLVAMAEIGKASHAYWSEHLMEWNDKFGNGEVMGKGENVAKADAAGGIWGAIRGAVGGTTLGPGGAAAGGILGAATGALVSSMTAAVKQVTGL